MSECPGKLYPVFELCRELTAQLLGIPIPGYAKYVVPGLLTIYLTDARLRDHQPSHSVHQYAKLPQRRIQGGRTGDDAYSQG
jgi:hypothetical protein